MKIGILEYQKFHKVYVETLSKICEDHIVKEFFNRQVALDNLNNLDLLFVNTIRPLPWDMLKWINFKSKCKTILSLHEVNTDFKTMKFIIKKFDAISVSLPSIKDYIVKNNLYKGKIFTFPFMLHEKVYPNTNKTMVVPGKIEKFRRDYDIIFRMMGKSQYWCLLGKPIGNYGQVVLGLCDVLKKSGYNIKTFDDFVPTDIYNDILKGCESIVAPLRNPTKGYNRLFKEYYGKTKAVGSMFEAIKYGKTFINNLDIQVDYKDYLPGDWKKYFEKEVVEEFLNE